MGFINYLINGISLGSVYAIIALGYTMVYGIAKMLNFAHGDVIMIGSYVVFVTVSTMGLPPMAGVLLAVAVCTLLGMTIERIAYKPCAAPHPLRFSLRQSASATCCRTLPFLSLEQIPNPSPPW